MKKKKFIFAGVACVLVLGFAQVIRLDSEPPFQCADEIGCIDIAPGEPVKIAILQALSGGASSLGATQLNCIELAMAHRNNTLHDHPIELDVIDSKCTAGGGANAALKVRADPRIVAVIGTSCSGAAVTAGKILSDAGYVMISGANSAPPLTSIGNRKGEHWRPGYFRTNINDSFVGGIAAEIVFKEFQFTRVATIDDGDAYTKGYADVFSKTFSELGGQVVFKGRIDKGDKNMIPILETAALSEAELIFFPVFQPEAIYIVRDSKKVAGLEKATLMTSLAPLDDTLVKELGNDGIGLYFAGNSIPDNPDTSQLRSEYESRFGSPPQHITYAYAYDAASLLFSAIERIAARDDGGALHIGRKALRDEMYATIDFKGKSGNLTCDMFGDCGDKMVEVFRLDDPAHGAKGVKSNSLYKFGNESRKGVRP